MFLRPSSFSIRNRMVPYQETKDDEASYRQGNAEFDNSASFDAQTSNTEEETDPLTKRSKNRKKKVDQACVYCRRSHMICDNSRPCLRCNKRGIGHLCHDEPTPGRQKKKPEVGSANRHEALPDVSTPETIPNPRPNPPEGQMADRVSMIVPPLPDTINTALSMRMFRPNSEAQLQAVQPRSEIGVNSPTNPSIRARPSLPKTMQFNQEPFFYSEHAGSEFSSLNDFLSMIDDPELVNGALQDSTTFADPILGFLMLPEGGNSNGNPNNILQFSPAAAQAPSFSDNQYMGYRQEGGGDNGADKDVKSRTRSFAQAEDKHQPVISDSARDKFFLTAADPTTEISPEERLKQVIKAKLEAGLLQPYNYAKGYARLQSYMDNYMNQSSRQRIMKPLLIFRPAFRAIARTLKDVDLVLVEESFERVLLDYDRVFTSMAIPACLWRRTGEIYRGNKEFASLVGVSTDDLKDGKLAIYELMSEESAVNFWEQYGAIAFDKGQKAVLTSCNIRTKDGFKRKSCCFSFTIRRDRYNIPSCIVGNFIPIDP